MMKYGRDCFYEYGRCLIEEKNGVFTGYLEREEKQWKSRLKSCRRIIQRAPVGVLCELERVQKIIKEVTR